MFRGIFCRTLVFIVLFAIAVCLWGNPGGIAVTVSPQQDDLPIPESAKTRVMVLGTPHLRAFGDTFNRSSLDALLAVLEDYAPDCIGVESLPSHAILAMQAREEDYSPVLEQFAGSIIELGRRAQEKLGVSWHEAEAECMQVLSGEPASLSAAEHIKFVANLLAAYRYHSALLQWSYLDAQTRDGDSFLPGPVKEDLNKTLGSANETVAVGLELARRLGRRQIFAIDDHCDKDDYMPIAEQLGQEMQSSPAVADGAWQAFYAEADKRMRAAHDAGDLLPHYLYLNSPEYTSADVRNQWYLFFRMKLASGLDRVRVALWEVRNLNIASNIRRMTAGKPGGRALVIIGASHKPFLDKYLRGMMDMEVIDLKDLIAE